MKQSGAELNFEDEKTTIAPWTSNPPRVDRSIRWVDDGVSYPRRVLKKQSIFIENPVEKKDALGHEIVLDFLNHFGVEMNEQSLNYVGKETSVEINLRDANDLLPPLAAILALSGGGRLVGASTPNTRKAIESNRQRPFSNRLDCNAKLKMMAFL